MDEQEKEFGKSILTKRQRMWRNLRLAGQTLEKRNKKRIEINTHPILVPILDQKASATRRVGREIC